jgi:hypothetical protein
MLSATISIAQRPVLISIKSLSLFIMPNMGLSSSIPTEESQDVDESTNVEERVNRRVERVNVK